MYVFIYIFCWYVYMNCCALPAAAFLVHAHKITHNVLPCSRITFFPLTAGVDKNSPFLSRAPISLITMHAIANEKILSIRHLPHGPQPFRVCRFVTVTLTGKANDVFKASKLIHDCCTACLAVCTSSIPPNFVSLLQRPSIQSIKQSIPVDNIFLPRKQDKNPKVVLEGYLEDVIKVCVTEKAA